jgi:hypothetical protein
MKSHWVDYREKKVFIVDDSGFGHDPDALRAEIEPAIELLSQPPLDSALVIASLEGTAARISNARVLKELLPRYNAHVHWRAMAGLTGTQSFKPNPFSRLTGKVSVASLSSLDQAVEGVVKE